MDEDFKALLNRIKLNQRDFSVDEAKTKQGSILPILNFLNWNVFDTNEVVPEYSVESKKVDYSLRILSKNKVFLEAKKASEDLEKHQEQLLNYSFREGVELAILTNGITWWFYLPLEKGSWEQRKFFTVDLNEQSLDDCAEKFESLLSRRNIESEIAYQNAKKLFESRQKNKVIKENLPKAWQKIISEPDEMLVELLNETLEKICGYTAEDEQVVDFLQNNSQQFSTEKLPTKIISSSKSKSINNNTSTSKNENLVALNAERLENLFFTKILEARFGKEVLGNSWRNILDGALKTAFSKGFSITELQDNLTINIKKGIYNGQGFSQIEGQNYSWQNQDANKTAENIVKLSKLLNYEIYILFEWREKGKFPFKQGLIHWKP